MQKNKHFVIRQIVLLVMGMLLALPFLFSQESSQASSCGDLTSYAAPEGVSIEVTDEGVVYNWEPSSDDRFLNYIIVAAKNDPTPTGDVNGYYIKISNREASGYTVDGSLSYNLSDFVKFEKNQSYYFALSIEYKCGYITTSEAVHLTFPDLDPPELIAPQITTTWGESGITVFWTSFSHEYLQDFVIVASQIDPQPSYPDNGYVDIVNTDQTSYLINNAKLYSNSDVQSFVPNTQYYIAVTARYVINGKDYYSTSNVQKVYYQGPSGDSTTYLSSPTITSAKSTANGFEIVWDAISDSRLSEYLILISQKGSPAYPYSGYVKALDKTATSYTINNSDTFTNVDFPGYLEYGQTYYFAVVAVYGNEHRTSSVYKHTYQGPLPSKTSDFIKLSVAESDDGYLAQWTPINDIRIASLYLVISPDVAEPTYSSDAWLVKVTNSSGATVPGIKSYKFSQTSFTKNGLIEELVEGATYNIRLTAILRDGTTFYSSPTTFTFTKNSTSPATDKSVIENVQESSTSGQAFDEVVEREKSAFLYGDEALISRVKGRVLLQVESKGEAWYVDPVSHRKYYLKDPKTAFVALRMFGLGIINDDLRKIPVGIEDRFTDQDKDGDGLGDKLEEGLGTDINLPDSDNDGYSDGEEIKHNYNPLGRGNLPIDNDLVERLKGRIVLQVEDRGQAWYIHPEDGRRYYMKDGQAAFDIMRYLSLGIANSDLRKIEVGEL